ncbi:unnamed protein product [Pedinophyceae sp. YPF-701]|nr:unnamed protein product [Pedinophyceae sp. YPF-701]
MGQNTSKGTGDVDTGRYEAITEGKKKAPKGQPAAIPDGCSAAAPEDYTTVTDALHKNMFFAKLDIDTQRKIVQHMYERPVRAGEILINEGDTGSGAAELYVVKSGDFEILERRQGVNMRVAVKGAGDVVGDVALIYNTARGATVAALSDAAVWVLHRDTFKHFCRVTREELTSQIQVFLNQVALLEPLTTEERIQLAEAFEERKYRPGEKVVQQGDAGDHFFIIRKGEAMVYQEENGQTKKINHLFKTDYFGEMSLLKDAPRVATVEAVTALECLVLGREAFNDTLGPLEEIMKRDKSPQVVNQKMRKLKNKGTPTRVPAEVVVKRSNPRPGEQAVVRARGHLDEVLELKEKKDTAGQPSRDRVKDAVLVLNQGEILGGGAFSKVSVVTEESTGRQYALKQMRKSAVVQCPEHVFCEQAITRNTAHPFCIRQYASFQDKYHLYFLFDLMTGGDLMDVLVAEANVIRVRVSQGGMSRGCLAPKVKMLQGMPESLARFYVASIVLALEYLHDNGIIYRDLKPENVFIGSSGYVKLGDFGFAKSLEATQRTYTFCGTPGYVAPENVLAHGYSYGVDWWGVGVLMYVLLTGKQPFSSPRAPDPMVVMRRIVDENWQIKYPPYLSPAAKDLISRLLERRPAKRLGMLQGKANDVKKHKWFDGFDWDALAARKMPAPRVPKNDAAKRLRDMAEQEARQEAPNETMEELQECQLVFASF